MTAEQFLPAAGFPDYEISTHGTVMRLSKAMGTHPGKSLKPWLSRQGYKVLALRKDGKYQKVYVHRLVMLTFVGKSTASQVNHKNGLKTDNRLENLEWCTASENLTHACSTLGKRRGSNHWLATLDESKVRAIRTAASKGVKCGVLAIQYGVSHASISRIIAGRTWRHVNLTS